MSIDEHVTTLEQLLRDLLTEHLRLIDLAGRHREALRLADGQVITELSIERDAVNARISALNSQRISVMAALATDVGIDAKSPTVRSLAESLTPPRSATLLALAGELRSAIESTRREHSILRDATAAFAGHISGVLSRAVEMCAPARTYTSAGRVSTASSLPGALDVRH
ncbi:MAG: flagellar export chaperone FlgN [Planctomycetota bacterium]